MEFSSYLTYLIENKDEEKYFDEDVLTHLIGYSFATKKSDVTGEYIKYELDKIKGVGDYFIIVRPYTNDKIGITLILDEADGEWVVLFEKIVGIEDKKNYKIVVNKFIKDSAAIVKKIGEL